MTAGDKDDRTGTLFDIGPGVAQERPVSRTKPVFTEHKARLVARYLRYFVFITKSGAYIDGFAGPQSESDDAPDWSAKLVLANEPRWLRKFFLFEQNPLQVARLEALLQAQPPRRPGESRRTIEIYPGDFNEELTKFLARSPIKPNEASFALLDQRNFECCWSSVVALANYKPAGEEKIELFYFLPNWWFHRASTQRKLEESVAEVDRWWGRGDWRDLLHMKSQDRAWAVTARFREEFKYRSVKAWPIFQRPNAGGGIMYFMIHATDHDEAPVLMNRAYKKVLDAPEPLAEMPQMDLLKWRQQAMEEAAADEANPPVFDED